MTQKKVILVTDGDNNAKKAIEIATDQIGGTCILYSAGNPTTLTGLELVDLIKASDKEPVVVMVDDKGKKGMGKGEEALDVIIEHPETDVLGVVAVASNGKDCNGIPLTKSITRHGEVIKGTVDKYGNKLKKNKICGDTLSVLRSKKGLIIIGIGDPGKMEDDDSIEKGAPITTMALKEVIKRAEE